ncbi:MAG: hypothetical protein ABI867_26295 [Kofleriaceae bacterium]
MNRIAIVAFSTLSLLACGKSDSGGGSSKAAEGTKAEAKPQAPIELTETVDLGAAVTDPDVTSYKGLKAKAPKDVKLEAGLTGVQINLAGAGGFELSKAFDAGYVAKIKGQASSSKLDKLVKFHVDTPAAILWESASELGGDNNFNFAAEVKVGEVSFKCGSEGYGRHTKVEAEALLKICQSITK